MNSVSQYSTIPHVLCTKIIMTMVNKQPQWMAVPILSHPHTSHSHCSNMIYATISFHCAITLTNHSFTTILIQLHDLNHSQGCSTNSHLQTLEWIHAEAILGQVQSGDVLSVALLAVHYLSWTFPKHNSHTHNCSILWTVNVIKFQSSHRQSVYKDHPYINMVGVNMPSSCKFYPITKTKNQTHREKLNNQEIHKDPFTMTLRLWPEHQENKSLSWES